MAEKLIAVPESQLTAIGDAIRLKTDSTTPIKVDQMPLQISLIEGGVNDKQVATYTFDVELTEDHTVNTIEYIYPSQEVQEDILNLFDDIMGDVFTSLRFKCCLCLSEVVYIGEDRADITYYNKNAIAMMVAYDKTNKTYTTNSGFNLNNSTNISGVSTASQNSVFNIYNKQPCVIMRQSAQPKGTYRVKLTILKNVIKFD